MYDAGESQNKKTQEAHLQKAWAEVNKVTTGSKEEHRLEYATNKWCQFEKIIILGGKDHGWEV